jgi:hypothetical protein
MPTFDTFPVKDRIFNLLIAKLLLSGGLTYLNVITQDKKLNKKTKTKVINAANSVSTLVEYLSQVEEFTIDENLILAFSDFITIVYNNPSIRDILALTLNNITEQDYTDVVKVKIELITKQELENLQALEK